MSEVRVNKLSPRSGTTVTLGDSGDTITIPSGVTFDASSGGLAGTLTTAAQPNITSVGTLTSFTSTGIDDNATSTAITIDSSENVGIGTNSPSRPLTVVGTGTSAGGVIVIDDAGSNGLEIQSNDPTILFYEDDTTDTNYQLRLISGSLTFQTQNDARTGASEKMRIDSSGNVGIGNTVASTINSANGTGNLVVGSGSGTEGITIYSGTTGEGTLQFADGTSGAATYVGQINYNHSSNDMSFATNSTERMRLDINGELIMRTGNKFVANRADNTRTVSLYCNNAAGYLETDSDPIVINGQEYTAFQIGGSEKMRIDSAGNLLIGRTNNPSGVSNSLYVTGVYSLTSGSGANVFVSSEGRLMRSTSSLRYKNTIENTTHGLTELLKLRPITYKGNTDGDKIYGGLIAEEVHEAGLTEFVEYNENGQPDALAYGNMVSICIKAIQEQQTKIEQLEAKITALETN